jgi:uncharacterized phiE125 gp8 family phage protein
MPLTLTRTTQPATEPVDLVEAKTHLRLDTNDYDSRITAFVQAAREALEIATERTMITSTWRLKLDAFPLARTRPATHRQLERGTLASEPGAAAIKLPRPPLQSVNSVKYVDTDGTEQTLSASKYIVDSDSDPARLTEAHGETWPDTRDIVNAVTIDYDAGYGDDAIDVPQALREAILMHVEMMHDRPVGSELSAMERAYQSLIAPFVMLTVR